MQDSTVRELKKIVLERIQKKEEGYAYSTIRKYLNKKSTKIPEYYRDNSLALSQDLRSVVHKLRSEGKIILGNGPEGSSPGSWLSACTDIHQFLERG